MMNMITYLSASQFLFFYGVVIVSVVVCLRYYLQAKDSTRAMVAPVHGDSIDPYELAYLRGGENELTRVIIVSLAEQGYLEIFEVRKFGSFWDSTEKKIRQATDGPDPTFLSEMERIVYDSFRCAQSGDEVFESNLPLRISGQCLPFEERLQQERLLCTDRDQRRIQGCRYLGFAVIGVIGLWRLMVGLGQNEAVGFLIIMLIGGIILISVHCGSERLSSLGHAYLEQLREGSAELTATNGTQYALAAALLGISALSDTPYADLGEQFKQSTAHVEGGCGGGGGCGGCGGCG